MIRVSYTSILFYLILISYKILLGIIYTNFISVVFQYAGFDFSTNINLFILSWALYLSLIFLLKPQYHQPSEFFLFVFLILIITPMLILMELGGKSQEFMLFTVLCFILIKVILITPKIKIPRVKYGNAVVLTISAMIIISTFLMFVVTGGITKINFDLSRVYELREETAQIYFGGGWGYITPWATKIFIPFFLSLSLFYKRYGLSIIIIINQVLIFGITGHRSMALLSIIALGLYVTRNKENKNLYIISLITISLLFIYLFHIYYDDLIISSTIARRAFFLPSFLNYSYYEFFSNNDYIYYSNSILSQLSEYPYENIQLSHVIAGQVLGQPEMSANTGFVGTSYAHAGFIGMIIISIFIAIVLKILDSTCKSDKHTWFYLSFASFPVLSMLTSAAFFTSLLTHGILLLIFITWMYEYKEAD